MERRRIYISVLIVLGALTLISARSVKIDQNVKNRIRPTEYPTLRADAVKEFKKAKKELAAAQDILMKCFGEDVAIEEIKSIPVTITAYSSTKDQCDSTPHITASMLPVRKGTVAVSRDILKDHGINFGKRVFLPGYGFFEVRDVMNQRWKSRIDIWESDREAARLFGIQEGTLMWIAAEMK